MASGSAMFKFIKPSMRPQSTDVQAAAAWGVAALTTAIWIVQLTFFNWWSLPSSKGQLEGGSCINR